MLQLSSSARLAPTSDAATGATLRLPAEAFVRLLFGRLDSDHTPDLLRPRASSSTRFAAGSPGSEPDWTYLFIARNGPASGRGDFSVAGGPGPKSIQLAVVRPPIRGDHQPVQRQGRGHSDGEREYRQPQPRQDFAQQRAGAPGERERSPIISPNVPKTSSQASDR